MMKHLLVLSFAMTILSACNSIVYDGPNNYQEAIEDVVRYNVALSDYIIDNDDLDERQWDTFVDKVFAFDEYMSGRWKKENIKAGYLKALTDISKRPTHIYYDYANGILKEYNNTSVILSDYYRINTSSKTNVWEFWEINTGIKFRFALGDTWSCEMDHDSWLQYLGKYLD